MEPFLIQVWKEMNHLSAKLELDKLLEVGTKEFVNWGLVKEQDWHVQQIMLMAKKVILQWFHLTLLWSLMLSSLTFNIKNKTLSNIEKTFVIFHLKK